MKKLLKCIIILFLLTDCTPKYKMYAPVKTHKPNLK